MLAATTSGYDVTTYITQSPGETTLFPTDNNPLTPEGYTEGKKAHLWILALAIALTATRIIHLAQYLRVTYYVSHAGSTDPKRTNWSRVRSRLQAITIGLVISTLMLIAALVIASNGFGKSVLGASIRLGLWIGGFMVEIMSHLCMPFYWWLYSDPNTPNSDYSLPPVNPDPDVKLHKRLRTIITIILGEVPAIHIPCHQVC
ncbi:unnamed protein product [Rhizoctonia solani]|uniref:Uncharacterized protein n=1 Tax=Rhizoctonia solani TaxID=456999 RepID=A0A8H3B888_9AGAM|nr:unnamed protein product [Rhizoctonia solani]